MSGNIISYLPRLCNCNRKCLFTHKCCICITHRTETAQVTPHLSWTGKFLWKWPFRSPLDGAPSVPWVGRIGWKDERKTLPFLWGRRLKNGLVDMAGTSSGVVRGVVRRAPAPWVLAARRRLSRRTRAAIEGRILAQDTMRCPTRDTGKAVRKCKFVSAVFIFSDFSEFKFIILFEY